MRKYWHSIYILLFLLLTTSLVGNAYANTQNTSSVTTMHITIVGNKNDEAAKSLYEAANNNAPKNAEIVWWDRREGKQPNPEIKYPVLKKPAAYICTENKCSLPAFTPAQLQTLIDHYTNKSATSVSVAGEHETNYQNYLNQLLKTKSIWVILPLFWFFGFLLALTPCVLPLMLIITSILGGSSENLTNKKAFLLSLIYVISLACTYAVAGIAVASFGVYLQGYLQNVWVLGSFSLLFILLGISLFGFFNISLPTRWRKAISSYSKTRKSGSYIGVAIMGVLATLIASPCVAAPLAGILAYVAESGNVKLGGLALFATGIGIGTPVILITTIGIELLQKAGKWQKYIKEFFGILLLAIAIWLLERIISATAVMLLWAALAIFTAIYMGALELQQEYHHANHAHVEKVVAAVSKMISLMLLVYGGALLIGALIGNTDPLMPLKRQAVMQSNNVQRAVSFQPINNKAELTQSLQTAKQLHKPVAIIFSADWCTSCKEMEKNVYPDPAIQKLLDQFTVLQVDVTDVKAATKELTQTFSVIGPPAIIFFDASGEKSSLRIDGAVSTDEFSKQLSTIKNNNKRS